MKKQIILILMMLLPMVVGAETVEIDGIYYEVITKGKVATVISNSNGYYTGNVVIPASVTYNGAEYSVTRIGESTFSGCSGLTSITIPNSVTSIEYMAFSGCSGLTAVHISDIAAWCNITFDYTSNPLYYAHHLYLGEEEIKDLVIPNSVTSIRAHVFSGCIGLTSVTIPNSVTSIGICAFCNCSSLTTVTIPNSLLNIGQEAFSGCNGLTSVHISDIAAWCNMSFNYDSNPLYYAHHLYLGEEEIKDLVIPNSVTSIGNYAFLNCSGLTSVTIPNSVTSIGDAAFSGCSSLTSITIPNSVTSIEESAFRGCSGLISVTIPNSVTSIEQFAFRGCSGLISATIGNAVMSIGNGGFRDCSSLTSVTIPNSLLNIGQEAFIGCSNLTTVHISDLAAWCKITFNGYDSNPLYYAHHLYLGEEEVKDLVIPNSVTRIGGIAFSDCIGLTSVTIPNSVTDIGEDAFYGCSSLATLTLPEDIKIIRKGTFQGCRIKNIVIPAKVEFIYADAFRCDGTEEVKVLATTPPWAHDNAFGNYNIPLYVPTESINDYQSTNPWSKFSTLKNLSGEDADLKCKTPTISYSNGKLTFNCETEGVEYNSSITDTDIKDYTTSSIQLNVTYTVKVYAVKSGYQNSDVATATLCWIDVEPKTEGIETGVAQVPAKAVLVQSREGVLTVQGTDDGTQVSVYDIDGTLAGNGVSCNGQATISTNLQAGSIAIVKIGQKAVKVVVK